MSLRLIVPPDRTEVVTTRLAEDDRTTNLVVLPRGGYPSLVVAACPAPGA